MKIKSDMKLESGSSALTNTYIARAELTNIVRFKAGAERDILRQYKEDSGLDLHIYSSKSFLFVCLGLHLLDSHQITSDSLACLARTQNEGIMACMLSDTLSETSMPICTPD